MRVGKFDRTREQGKRAVGTSRGGSVRQSAFLDKLHEQQWALSWEEALEKIDHHADELRRNPTFENLQRYKQTIRAFLANTLEKLYLVDQQSFYDTYGRRRIFVLIKNADAKLEELTQTVLAKQSSAIDLARRLDEIRGILCDLYT